MRQFAGFLITLVCFFSVAVAPSAGAVKNDELAFQRAKEAYTRLLTSTAPQRSHRDRWVAVIERLQGFADLHPDHLRAPEAEFLAAQATEQIYRISRLAADARAAVEAYDQLAKNYPESEFAAKGLWHAALLCEAPLRDLSGAYRHYAQLVESFPRSQPGADAQPKLKKLAAYAPTDHLVATERPLKAPKAAAGVVRGTLTGVRAWSNPGYTRIVLDLSQPTDYSSNLLRSDEMTGAPPRLYIDLPNTTPVGGLPETSVVNDGLLQQIRAGQPVLGRTRVVLDLRSLSAYKVFTLAEPYRIIIDITGAAAPASAELPVAGTAKKTENPPVAGITAPAAVAPVVPPPVAVVKPAESPKLAKPSEAQKPKSLDPSPDKIAAILDSVPPEPPAQALPSSVATTIVHRIVIDAGHGGKDPGAIGPSGLHEKDVALAMALLLADEISTEFGWEVILTRNDDTFIPLEERTAVANKAGADLFLSIHANASTNAAARGIETYYLNFSKNEKAAAVAARENGTSLQQVGDLEQILFDLMAHSKIQESSRLASEIQSSLVDSMGQQYPQIKDLGVKQGPFYVLLGANMPSVLVEAAFISNSTEETRLASRKYQKLVTKAILEGVRAYAGSLKVVAQQ